MPKYVSEVLLWGWAYSSRNLEDGPDKVLTSASVLWHHSWLHGFSFTSFFISSLISWFSPLRIHSSSFYSSPLPAPSSHVCPLSLSDVTLRTFADTDTRSFSPSPSLVLSFSFIWRLKPPLLGILKAAVPTHFVSKVLLNSELTPHSLAHHCPLMPSWLGSWRCQHSHGIRSTGWSAIMILFNLPLDFLL